MNRLARNGELIYDQEEYDAVDDPTATCEGDMESLRKSRIVLPRCEHKGLPSLHTSFLSLRVSI